MKASTTEFRFEVVELARSVASEVEAASDEIRNTSDDPAVRRDALRWKVNAIPEIQSAAVGPDPVIAGIDVWALVLQMRNFFNTGPGAAAFGEHAHIAQEAMARAEQRVNQMIERVSTAHGARERPVLEKWATENPIEGFDFRRDSIGTELAKSLRGAEEGGLAALDQAQASMDRLEYRLALMNEYIPKQMTWNAQLATYDEIVNGELDSTLDNLNLTLHSTSQLAQQMPGLLDAQRVAAFQSIDQQRVLTLDNVSRERQAVMSEAARLVNEQRVLTMKDVDQLVQQRSQSVIDFALKRLAQSVGALLLVGIALYALWRLTRPGESRGAVRVERRSAWSPQHHPGRRASDRGHPAH